jgi:medium-chain acyl-[acyl-carrier-protein] hydrolase
MLKPAGTTQWIKALTPNPRSRVRLFCFPYAGGNAAIFHDWTRALPPDVEVCAALLPGRGSRILEPPLTRLSAVVAHLADAITSYLDKPFTFFGHSMGALTAFDLARRLRREVGVEPSHLFVSGCRAPHLTDPDPPVYDLPDPEFIEYLRRLNGTPEEVLEKQELMTLIMPILRADFEAGSTYAYVEEPPLGYPVTAYGGLRDSMVWREHLAAWREHTTAGFALRMFDGDHFFIHQTGPQLISMIGRELSRLTGGDA